MQSLVVQRASSIDLLSGNSGRHCTRLGEVAPLIESLDASLLHFCSAHLPAERRSFDG
jgi:hypothetical protein